MHLRLGAPPSTTRCGLSALIAVSLVALGSCSSGTTSANTSSTVTTSNDARADLGTIVFFDDAHGVNGHQQVYIERSDGTDARRLVTSEFDDWNPTLSPDGKEVAFIRSHDPDPDRIFLVRPDGTGLRQLTPDGCPAGSRCGDSMEGHPWSPDGRQVVFTRALFPGSATQPTNVGLWVMRADGSGAHQITLADAPGCSNSCAGSSQDDNAAWSPDGDRIVFRRWTYGSPDLFTIDTVASDGTDLRQVTSHTMQADDPAWSPDGRLIVFQSPPDPAPGVVQRLYTIRPDGSHVTRLDLQLPASADGGQGTNHPSWSPDGAHIVFAHSPSTLQGSDLFVMNPDGTNVRLLADTPLIENAPFWGTTSAGG